LSFSIVMYDYSSNQCYSCTNSIRRFKGFLITWTLVSRILSKEPPFSKGALFGNRKALRWLFGRSNSNTILWLPCTSSSEYHEARA
jgi:hypothetical protein